MARYDFTAARLFVEDDLAAGAAVLLDAGRANYLRNVLRLGAGDGLLLFNGRDGEFAARIADADRKRVRLAVADRVRPQETLPDIHYLFAPLKHARLDYLVQKAVEMGAGRLVPVLTRHTQVRRVNRERMVANVREAAEQCGVIAVPPVDPPRDLDAVLADLAPDRVLVVADEAESGTGRDPLARLAGLPAGTPTALLVGPEGGFADAERALFARRPRHLVLPLGPRILRADTAAVAALALLQASAGDWRAAADEP